MEPPDADAPLEAGILRAIAHPYRLNILQHLASAGPATATQCARVVGLSPSACSWHLRFLGKLGLVERTGGGDGRERPWRYTGPYSMELPDTGPGSPGRLISQASLVNDTKVVRAYLDHAQSYTQEWQDAALFLNGSLFMTPAELRALAEELKHLTAGYMRLDPAERPAGAERVYVAMYAVPWSQQGHEDPQGGNDG